MATELTTVWVSHTKGTTIVEQEMKRIAGMLDEGWELASWQPLIHFGTGTCYEVFLLKKGSPHEGGIK